MEGSLRFLIRVSSVENGLETLPTLVPELRHVGGGQVMEWCEEECRYRASDAGKGLLPEATVNTYLSDLLQLGGI